MATNVDKILLGEQGWGRNPNLSDQVNIANFSSASLVPDFENFDGMSDAINYNVISFCLHTPTMFDSLGEHGKLIRRAIKNLIECHAVRIDGLNKRIEVSTYETDFHGGGGEKIQTFDNVTLAQSVISTTFNDKMNRPMQRLLEFWIRYGVGDPYSKTPISSIYDRDARFRELLPSMTSCIVLNVAPNATKTAVDKAWLTFNFFPRTAGENTGQKDLNVKGVGNQLQIEWLGTTQHGVGVDALAKKMLERLNRPALNSNLQKAGITDIDPETDELTSGLLYQLDEQYKTNISYEDAPV